jgi:hypothetical protein
MEKEIEQAISDVSPEGMESGKDALLVEAQIDISLLMGRLSEDSSDDKAKLEDIENSFRVSKEGLQKKYPDRLQEIEILYDLWETNRGQKRIDGLTAKENELKKKTWECAAALKDDRFDRKEKLKIIRDSKDIDRKLAQVRNEKRDIFVSLTSWNFLVTNHIINNSGNREYLGQFWNALGEVDAMTGGDDFKRKQKGLVGQAGLYHIMRDAGSCADLATPREDAFKKTDLKLRVPGHKNVLIQTKHTVLERDVIFESTDDLSYPGVESRDGGQRRHFSEKHIKEMSHLAMSCRKESEETGEKVSGYYVVLPEGSLDGITAEPKPEVVELFKKKLETLS